MLNNEHLSQQYKSKEWENGRKEQNQVGSGEKQQQLKDPRGYCILKKDKFN